MKHTRKTTVTGIDMTDEQIGEWTEKVKADKKIRQVTPLPPISNHNVELLNIATSIRRDQEQSQQKSCIIL